MTARTASSRLSIRRSSVPPRVCLPAFEQAEGWVERVRAGLRALLEFLDDEPGLGRLASSTRSAPALSRSSAARAWWGP